MSVAVWTPALAATLQPVLSGRWHGGQDQEWSLEQRVSGRRRDLEWSLVFRQRQHETPWPARFALGLQGASPWGQWWVGRLNLDLGGGALYGRSGGFALSPPRAGARARVGMGSASSWRPELWGVGWQHTVHRLEGGLVLSRTPRDLSSDGRGFVLDMLHDLGPTRAPRINAFREDQLAGWLGSSAPAGGWHCAGLVRNLPDGAAQSRSGVALTLDRRMGPWQLAGSLVRSEHRLAWAQARWQRKRQPGLQLDLWHGQQGERRDFAQLPVPVPNHGPGLGLASRLSLPLKGPFGPWTLELEERRRQLRDTAAEPLLWQRDWNLAARLAGPEEALGLAFSSISGSARYALQFRKNLGPGLEIHYQLKASAEPGASARSSFFQIRVEQDRSAARFHVLLRDQGADRPVQLFFPVPGLPQLESGSGDSDRLGLGLQRETGVGRYGHGRMAVALERVIRFREKREGAFTVREPRDRWRMGLTWSWFPG